jgi:hypothetical protein
VQVRELAATLNVTRPRTLSQRDVPGLSRAVVPLLAKAGVHTVSIGANGGSASPDLPGYDLSRDAVRTTTKLQVRESACTNCRDKLWQDY